MDPREYLLRYFTDLDKIDIPINVKDNSFGGKLSRFGSRIGTPVKNFLNRRASIPNLLTPRSSSIPSPWGGSITSSPVVNTLAGEVVDVAATSPRSFLSQVKGRLPQGVLRFAGLNNPVVRRALGPVLDTTVGSVMDWGEGMSPIHALGRNVTGTAFGIPAYLAGEAALPMVPLSGVPAYLLANQLGKEQFDRFYSGSDSDSTETAVNSLDNLPNDLQPLPTHIRENRGPKHLETGVGPKHLQITEGAGTKLVRMPDGSIRRVPIETEINDSTVISQDGVVVDEVLESPGESISDQVSDFLDMTDWESSRRYKNSPAVRSGVFTREQLRNQRRMHEDFKSHRDAGTLEEFARAYPQSQTAKKMRRDAPYGRPVDF